MANKSVLNSFVILLLCAAVGIVVSGCQQNPSNVEAKKNEPQTVKLALCADIAPDALNDRGQADCTLGSNDGSGLMLELQYGTPADNDEYGEVAVEIKVITADGNAAQTIKETSEFVYGFPTLQDLDADGRNEILVPLMTGNVNTVYAVWRSVPDAYLYTRVGEISGVSFEAKEDGVFQTSARASAASWAMSYFKIIDDNITSIATAMVELPDSDDGVEKCTVSDDGGLALIGLTLDQAQGKFCTR